MNSSSRFIERDGSKFHVIQRRNASLPHPRYPQAQACCLSILRTASGWGCSFIATGPRGITAGSDTAASGHVSATHRALCRLAQVSSGDLRAGPGWCCRQLHTRPQDLPGCPHGNTSLCTDQLQPPGHPLARLWPDAAARRRLMPSPSAAPSTEDRRVNCTGHAVLGEALFRSHALRRRQGIRSAALAARSPSTSLQTYRGSKPCHIDGIGLDKNARVYQADAGPFAHWRVRANNRHISRVIHADVHTAPARPVGVPG